MPSRVLTTANQITILRLVFVPIFAILVIHQNYKWAFIVLAVAAISDVVDGNVARFFHQESPVGVALDPIADKILMTTAYLVLGFRDALPMWLTVLVISRDVAIVTTAALIILVAGYRPFRPTILGKASTTVQVATIFFAVGYQAQVALASYFLLHVCIYLTAALTAASGVHYLWVVRFRYAHSSDEGKPPAPASEN